MKKALAILLFCVLCNLSSGENIELTDGSVLTNVQVILRTPHEVFISCIESGRPVTRNIPFSAMSEHWRSKYGYNRESAREYRSRQAQMEAEQNRIRAAELARINESKARPRAGNITSNIAQGSTNSRLSTAQEVKPSISTPRPVDWQELQLDHFRIYHKGSPALADKTGKFLEERLKAMTVRLNIATGLDILWYGPNAVKFYIYPSQAEMLQNSSLPKWAAGYADYANRKICSIEDENDIRRIVTHELGHLLFYELMNRKPTIAWLDEGMAMWLEPDESRNARKKTMSKAKEKNTLMSLDEVTTMRNYQSLEPGKARLFYGQSEKLVEILMQAYDFTVFRSFCIQIQNGADFPTAFSIFYSGKFRTLDGLEKAWLDAM